MLKTNTWFVPVPADAPESATCCQSFWDGRSPALRKIADKAIWFISTGRNAVVVISCLGIAYGFDPVYDKEFPRNNTFILTGMMAWKV